jgi:flagellar biosynthesis/type III secretory pathway M-ring protein FliF/YscJ
MRTAGSERGSAGEGSAPAPRRSDSSTRVAWFVAALGLAAAVAAWAMPTGSPALIPIAGEKHRLSELETARAQAELSAKGIESQVDEGGRLLVPADQRTKIATILKDAGIGRSIEEIRNDAQSRASWLDSTADRQRRELDTQGLMLAKMLEERDDILAATVIANAVPSGRIGAAPAVTATLNLKGASDIPLSRDSIAVVVKLALRTIVGLAPKDLTIYDGQRFYPVDDPAAEGGPGADWRLEADRLGSRVSERIAGFAAGLTAKVDLAAGPPPKAPGRMAINAPLSEEPREADPTPSEARVIVLSPTGVDIIALRSKLEPAIRDALGAYRLQDLRVEAIPARASAKEERPAPIASKAGPEASAEAATGSLLDWKFRWNNPVPLVAIGGTLAAIILGLILILGRNRQGAVRDIAPAPSTRRRIDPPQSPGHPNESHADRTRDFARAEPDAAAGVLRRWSEQGGGPHE